MNETNLDVTRAREVHEQARRRAFALRRQDIDGDVGYTLENLRTGRVRGHYSTLKGVFDALLRHPVLTEFSVRLTRPDGVTEEISLWGDDGGDALIRAVRATGRRDIVKAEIIRPGAGRLQPE